MSLKDNRTVQFAVGCTVILLAVRWLLTGDLLLLVEAAKPVEEGATRSVDLVSIVWPMATDAIVLIGISAIAFAMKIWNAAYQLFQSVLDSGKSKQSEPVQAASESVSQQRELVLELARAARAGDREQVISLAAQLRTTEAIAADFVKAAKAADAVSMERFSAELKGQSFMDSPTQSAPKRSSKGTVNE